MLPYYRKYYRGPIRSYNTIDAKCFTYHNWPYLYPGHLPSEWIKIDQCDSLNRH